MAEPNIFVTTRQAAVGQGGLMTCCITATNGSGVPSKLNIVFDCGSINREHLRSGIDGIEGENIDVLFISHLDADHCNGIDLLLAQTRVDTVVLPCLDAASLTAIACAGLAEGGVSGNFRAFLRDPVAWFGERGVKRVMLVTRDTDGDDGAPTFNPDDDAPLQYWVDFSENEKRDDGKLRVRVDGRGAPYSRRVVNKVPVEMRTLPASTSFGIELPAVHGMPVSLYWLLLPYVHPFPKEALEAFRARVRSVLSIPQDTALASKAFTTKLLNILQDEKKRQKLKECYSEVSSDNNRPSMSLFSGPLNSRGPVQVDHAGEYPWHRWVAPASPYITPPLRGYGNKPGWISTGDSDLNTAATRSAWLRRYKGLLEQVGIFLLPHHGSNRSMHSEMLDCLPDVLTIACAARGRKHHPHPALISRLRHRGMGLWQVSEEMESDFVSTVRLRS